MTTNAELIAELREVAKGYGIENATAFPKSMGGLALRAADALEASEARVRQMEAARVGTGWTRPDGEEFFGEAALVECGRYWEDRLARSEARVRRVAQEAYKHGASDRGGKSVIEIEHKEAMNRCIDAILAEEE